MDILRAQFLFSCRKLKNGTHYYDSYDINEKIELQNITVSGPPFYNTVSINKFKHFIHSNVLNFLLFLRMFCVITQMIFSIYWSQKSSENLMQLIAS